MKIAFCVVKNLDFCGGIEKYTLELGSRLVRRGHEVAVYSMRHYGHVPNRMADMRILGIPSVPLRRLEKLTASASAAFHVMLKGKPDIVHFQHITPGSLAWIPKLRGIKSVCQAHGLAWRSSPWGRGASAFLRMLERIAVRQCDALIALTSVQQQFYRDRYGLEAVCIPPGTSVREKTEPREILRWGLKPNQYVLYLGRLSPEKGTHYLIPAFRRLDTSCRLVLAGDASEERYRKKLHALAGGDERILFPGFVRGRPLAELLSNALAYVQPSELEGLSIALLEAMGYGNCCLVSDIPENLEAIGDAGWCFENKNVDSLHERMDWLIRHRDEAQAVAEKAKPRVASHYSWDAITSRFEQLYAHVLNAKAA